MLYNFVNRHVIQINKWPIIQPITRKVTDSKNYSEKQILRAIFRFLSATFPELSPPSCSTHVKIQPLFSLVHVETLLWELCQRGIYLLPYFTRNLLHFFLSLLLNLNLVFNDLSLIFPSNKKHISEIYKQFIYLYAVVSDLARVAKFLAYSGIGVQYPNFGWLLIIK